MPKYKYTGDEPQNLAGVGIVNPGDVITVSPEIASGLERHAPEQFKFVPQEAVPVVHPPTEGHKGAVAHAIADAKAAKAAAIAAKAGADKAPTEGVKEDGPAK